MVKKLPDWMGTWRTSLGESGNFFYFQSKGRIVDALGLSQVTEVEISDEKIRFVKTYLNPRGRAARFPILFEGNLVGQNYRGTYKIQEPNQTDEDCGTFSIEPYSSLGWMDSRVEHLLMIHDP
jgi:hypothetical protein